MDIPELHFGLALNIPLTRGICEEAAADRQMNREILVLRTGLEQQHPVTTILAQPRGDAAAWPNPGRG